MKSKDSGGNGAPPIPPPGKRRRRVLKERDEDSPSPSLWGVIVNNDDICFQHILPRLNRTDVKFLYEVNAETRAMIKRSSSRKGDLRKKFKVEEMSSISTLEIAWEDRTLWPSDWDERDFAWEVAKTNKLELLKWIREEKKCKLDADTIRVPIFNDNMEMVKYCVANGCPLDEESCEEAARNGNLEMLKYLHEEAKAPWDWKTADRAAYDGHLHILKYLSERKYKFGARSCAAAGEGGQLECLKYLHEVAKARWTSSSIIKTVSARMFLERFEKRRECLRYLLDNDCPLGNCSRERLLSIVANGRSAALTRP